jgi:hypothetical protein
VAQAIAAIAAKEGSTLVDRGIVSHGAARPDKTPTKKVGMDLSIVKSNRDSRNV